MAHGGTRPGAGRRTGATNKKSAKQIAAAEATGLLPHEWMLDVMRGGQIKDAFVKDGEVIEFERVPTFEEKLDAAKAAAPFYAPKLAAKAIIPDSGKNPIEELMELASKASTNRAKVGA